MIRKNYFTFLLTLALFLASGIAVFAQNAPVTGRVELTKADGTKTPVAGALVEVFRTDQKVKLPTAKTDKKGFFAFVGLPLGGRYILSVSGAGIAPAIYPNVPAGSENIVIAVSEGDGKRYTEDEAKQAVTSRTSTTQTNNVSEEDKKREEEIRKQNEAVLAENKKIEKANEIIGASQKEGNAAFEAGRKALSEKNYDSALTSFELAITKYIEGFEAAPTFVPSATTFLNNLSATYINHADAKYKTVTNDNRRSVLEAVKSSTEKAVENAEKSLELLKTATPRDEAQRLDFENRKFAALRNRKEAFYIMVRSGADRTKGKEAMVAFQEYLDAEKVPAEKLKAQLVFAEVMIDAEERDQALSIYQRILAESSENLDALFGAGANLVMLAYINGEDKARFQTAINYLQKFFDLAPANHPRKNDAKTLIDTIKKDYKLNPQKIAK